MAKGTGYSPKWGLSCPNPTPHPMAWVRDGATSVPFQLPQQHPHSTPHITTHNHTIHRSSPLTPTGRTRVTSCTDSTPNRSATRAGGDASPNRSHMHPGASIKNTAPEEKWSTEGQRWGGRCTSSPSSHGVTLSGSLGSTSMGKPCCRQGRSRAGGVERVGGEWGGWGVP